MRAPPSGPAATPARRRSLAGAPPPNPVPVFPLPGTVLFPHTRLPLRVFELRYRTMLRDALSRGRILALALLEPGWETDYPGSPPFHELGCLARIDVVEWLPNDCYEIEVVGTTRIRFAKVVREFPYRAARWEPVPEHPYPEDDPLVVIEKRALTAAFERFLARLGIHESQGQLDRAASYVALVNALCTCAGLSPAARLELLAVDSVLERGRRIREHVERLLRRGGTGRDPGSGPETPGTPGTPDAEGELN